MVIGVARFDLYIPEARSLKEKRSVVRRVVDRVRNQFPVSVAEVDSLDLHQRATIGFAVVSGSAEVADRVVEGVLRFVEDQHLAQILSVDREFVHF
ncbi:DUF503 domain-containing protein [Deferrisoma sp.]